MGNSIRLIRPWNPMEPIVGHHPPLKGTAISTHAGVMNALSAVENSVGKPTFTYFSYFSHLLLPNTDVRDDQLRSHRSTTASSTGLLTPEAWSTT